MKCNKCNHQNENDAKYCTNCGNQLVEEKPRKLVCVNCYTENEPEVKNCKECGKTEFVLAGKPDDVFFLHN